MNIFIDTWGWVVLHNTREAKHAEVSRFYMLFEPKRDAVITTDFVLDETFTLLYQRLS